MAALLTVALMEAFMALRTSGGVLDGAQTPIQDGMEAPLKTSTSDGMPGKLFTVVGCAMAIHFNLPAATMGPPTGMVVKTASKWPPAASMIMGAPPL